MKRIILAPPAGAASSSQTPRSVLAALSPGLPGVVDVDGTGDTAVLGPPCWDCPPYA